MKHEKVFIREDKTKIKIEVWLFVDRYDISWTIEVSTCQPKKRTWVNVYSTDDWSWRKLNQSGREEYARQKQLAVCTIDEIDEVQRELITQIKTIKS